jgi:Icc-related predicted phosphoesterase
LINRYNPRYFLHGHIHRFFDNDGDRITRVRRTQVINCYGHYILDITD